METQVRQSILGLLKSSLSAIKKGDTFRLKELSDSNISSAALFQDEDSLTVSVVVYALSKLIEHSRRKRLMESKLHRALALLESGKDDAYRSEMDKLVSIIRKEDYRLKRFVSSVIEQARVKKGCNLCAQGISIGRVASIFGISKWELMNYFGKTSIPEQSSERIPTESRLEVARRLFA